MNFCPAAKPGGPSVVARTGSAAARGGCCWVPPLTDRSNHNALDFDAEFRGAHPTLWVLAAGIVLHRSDADDVVQEAAIIGLQKLGSFRPGTNFRAWMGEIVRNVALNHRRGERRRARRLGARIDVHDAPIAGRPDRPEGTGLGEALGGVTGSGTGSLHGLREQLDDHLAHALQALDPIVRTCVLLRCVQGLTYREISLLMSIPEGTAMSHVFRGRGTLAAALSSSKSRSGVNIPGSIPPKRGGEKQR